METKIVFCNTKRNIVMGIQNCVIITSRTAALNSSGPEMCGAVTLYSSGLEICVVLRHSIPLAARVHNCLGADVEVPYVCVNIADSSTPEISLTRERGNMQRDKPLYVAGRGWKRILPLVLSSVTARCNCLWN